MTTPMPAPKPAAPSAPPPTGEAAVQAILELTAKHFKVEPSTLTPATRFREDLRADSLDLVLLVHEVEDRFQVVIEQEELLKVRTIGDAIEMASKPRKG